MFLIVSDSFSESAIPRIFQHKPVRFMCFVQMQKDTKSTQNSYHKEWGTYTDILPICERLRVDTSHSSNHMIGVEVTNSKILRVHKGE